MWWLRTWRWCISVYSLLVIIKIKTKREMLLRHSTVGPQHRSCVAMRVLPLQTPLDSVSSPGSPSLLQMCRAESGSQRLERTGQTGMQWGGSGVRTAGGGKRRKELGRGETKLPVGGLWEFSLDADTGRKLLSWQMWGTSVSYARQVRQPTFLRAQRAFIYRFNKE